jgi:TonB family protein
MTESVSDILVARQREFDHAGRPIAASFGVHVLLVIGLAVLPAAWFRGKAPAPTMTISLGPGSTGQDRSGQTSTGGRDVEKVVPPEKHETIVPVTPPKSVTPDPAAPVVKTPPKVADKPAAPNPVPSPPKQATGAQLNKGSALVETGAKGNEIGLASGGGGDNSTDIDSCCKAFFSELKERVDQRWQRNQGTSGVTIIEFTIERDGTVSASHVATSSGNDVLDLAAWSAVKSVQLSPIPDEYKGKRMTILLRFPYIR